LAENSRVHIGARKKDIYVPMPEGRGVVMETPAAPVGQEGDPPMVQIAENIVDMRMGDKCIGDTFDPSPGVDGIHYMDGMIQKRNN